MSSLRLPFLTLLLIAVVGVGFPAFADEPPPSNPPSDNSDPKLKPPSKTQKEENPEKTQKARTLSASRKFLKIFDKTPKKSREAILIRADKIAVTKPDGWVEKKSTNPYIIIRLQQAGRPQNRIEIRKAGEEIPVSRLATYLSSFTSMFERAGFESIQQDFPGVRKIFTSPGSPPKYLIGGLKGDYLKYLLSKSSSLNLPKDDVGVLLFLYKDKKEAWIFVAYSTIREIEVIQPVFQDVVKSAQFDF